MTSTMPAERDAENVWMIFRIGDDGPGTAENAAVSLSFSMPGLTRQKRQKCYAFEHFASRRDDIRTTYYYHY